MEGRMIPSPRFPNGLAVRLALLGGLGRAPLAPGTVATFLGGLPCGCLLGLMRPKLALAATVLIVAASCYIADRAEKALGRHDASEIVIDELAGYLVTVVGFPLSAWSLLGGGVLFRLFDIWKPWPIGKIDRRVGGGLGVVLDDVVAGLFAHALLWLTCRVLA
jgi:phosphatidylglycerophosphatase A